MIIAHFSDPHLCGLRSDWNQLRSDKQLLGALNWITRRGKLHNAIKVEEAILQVLDRKPDLLLITGDISQLALENDYRNMATMLQPVKDAGIPAIIMRGNHDMYSQKPLVIQAFKSLRKHMLGQLATSGYGVYSFPELTIAEVDAAVPTNITDCNGEIRAEVIDRLSESIQQSNPMIPRICCCHFPILQADGQPQPEHKSLHGREPLLHMLQHNNFQLYLCGHIHQPFSIDLGAGLTQFCAGSASAGGCLNFFQSINGKVSLLSSQQL